MGALPFQKGEVLVPAEQLYPVGALIADKTSAWEGLARNHAPLRMRYDFQRFSSDVEH
jgi:hypothetical protein